MGERPIGAWMESRFKHPMRLLQCDQLWPARPGEDPDYLVAGQRLVFRKVLVVLLPMRCVAGRAPAAGGESRAPQ